MLIQIGATSDSLVLGETYDEVAQVPERVMDAEILVGTERVVCVFDQNMYCPEGEILGTTLTRQLRSARDGFMGLILMRSANGSGQSQGLYKAAGADATLSKGLTTAQTVMEIQRLCEERPYCKNSAIGRVCH